MSSGRGSDRCTEQCSICCCAVLSILLTSSGAPSINIALSPLFCISAAAGSLLRKEKRKVSGNDAASILLWSRSCFANIITDRNHTQPSYLWYVTDFPANHISRFAWRPRSCGRPDCQALINSQFFIGFSISDHHHHSITSVLAACLGRILAFLVAVDFSIARSLSPFL